MNDADIHEIERLKDENSRLRAEIALLRSNEVVREEGQNRYRLLTFFSGKLSDVFVVCVVDSDHASYFSPLQTIRHDSPCVVQSVAWPVSLFDPYVGKLDNVLKTYIKLNQLERHQERLRWLDR